MALLYRYVPQCYRDSVSLMQFSQAWKAKPGVEEASAVMATAANLALLKESGLLTEDLAARPDDLLLLVGGPEVTQADLEAAEAELRRPPAPTAGGVVVELPASVREAHKANPGLNFALISVPGDYAAAEALKALAAGLHVMLFSDNVTLADEVSLKQEAAKRGLLLLGPDCGTAVVNGVPLGFANQIRRGPIGVVSASGTGLQEVTSLLDRWGSGVSQALGTGGRDLKDSVGGLTSLACLDLLDADPATRVILVVGKPPGPAVRRLLDARIAQLSKPTVVCLLGDAGAPTLAEAAGLAFAAAEGRRPDGESAETESLPRRSGARGRYLRGLYSGGTLCAEAALLAARSLGDVRANVSVPGVLALDDPWTSVGHCLVDLGEDEFTRGRPHPMIDQGLRLGRLAREAADPETAVLLLDVVLGHGAHLDPASELAAFAAGLEPRAGGPVPIVASLTGTEADPQGWSRSAAILRNAGVLVYGRHDQAVQAALALVPTAPRTQESL